MGELEESIIKAKLSSLLSSSPDGTHDKEGYSFEFPEMVIPNNAKLPTLLPSSPNATLPSFVCCLNQSTWDVLPFSFPEWDDSLDGSTERAGPSHDSLDGLPERAKPSGYKETTSSPTPLTVVSSLGELLIPSVKVSLRRKVRRWDWEEEDTLRIAVQRFCKGNQKVILHCYRDIVAERTEVDLKDKWRNMTRH